MFRGPVTKRRAPDKIPREKGALAWHLWDALRINPGFSIVKTLIFLSIRTRSAFIYCQPGWIGTRGELGHRPRSIPGTQTTPVGNTNGPTRILQRKGFVQKHILRLGGSTIVLKGCGCSDWLTDDNHSQSYQKSIENRSKLALDNKGLKRRKKTGG